MKRVLVGALLVGATLLGQSVVFASGVSLSWSDCGALGQATRAFACDTNSGTNVLVGSVMFDSAYAAFSGVQTFIEIQSESVALPAWWQIHGAGLCRDRAYEIVQETLTSPSSCRVLPYITGNFRGLLFDAGYGGPNRARIRLLIDQGNYWPPGPQPGIEYHAFMLSISNAKTTGAGACGGCAVPVCINLRAIQLMPPSLNTIVVTPLARAHVTWQNASDATCVGATPARRSTWGAIKSLYR